MAIERTSLPIPLPGTPETAHIRSTPDALLDVERQHNPGQVTLFVQSTTSPDRRIRKHAWTSSLQCSKYLVQTVQYHLAKRLRLPSNVHKYLSSQQFSGAESTNPDFYQYAIWTFKQMERSTKMVIVQKKREDGAEGRKQRLRSIPPMNNILLCWKASRDFYVEPVPVLDPQDEVAVFVLLREKWYSIAPWWERLCPCRGITAVKEVQVRSSLTGDLTG